VQGGTFTQLTNDPKWDYEPAWSPDGTAIAFVSARDGTPHIYLMDADGKNQRRLSTSDIDQLEPAWSPDGKQIAFLSEEGNNHSNIYLMDSDGTNIRNLTNQPTGLNENPTWSPDGTMIAFWSDRTGNHEIFSMMLDGTGLVNLTNNPADDENPTWSK
jgi:tol-pal system beta propeller repeat protein TolB